MADPLLEIFAEGLGLSADALDEESSPDTVEELQNTLGDEYQNVVEAISGGG